LSGTFGPLGSLLASLEARVYDQFIPLYVVLPMGSLVAAGAAIWMGWKLHAGTLHLLGAPEPEFEPPPIEIDSPPPAPRSALLSK
jgi:hypothetical protein